MKIYKIMMLTALFAVSTVATQDNYLNGKTVLHHAIASDDVTVQIVQQLVEAGADVNALDNEGCTPLFQVFACLLESIIIIYIDGMQDAVPEEYYQEYILIAEYLVQSGADLTIIYSCDGIEEIQGLHQTLPETITWGKTVLAHKMQLSDDDHEKACIQKMISYMDKLQAVLV